MNPAKYTGIEYINFLIATQKVYSCSEAERVQPQTDSSAAHDAINRLYDKQVDGATKNDHFRAMLTTAKTRGFQPQCVAFDSWFSGLDNACNGLNTSGRLRNTIVV